MRTRFDIVLAYGTGLAAAIVYLGIFAAVSWWPLACDNPWRAP